MPCLLGGVGAEEQAGRIVSNLFATPWHRNVIHAYDTETTGISPDLDRIVTATFATINGETGETSCQQWLLKCPIPINPEAVKVHGVTDEYAAEHGQDPAVAVREIAECLARAERSGRPVVGHNVVYDFTITERECRRYGVTYTQPIAVDTLCIDKTVDKWRKGKRTLTAVCEHYGVRLDGAHDATEDALAAARVAWALAERYPDVVQVPPADLHAKQIEWKREQAESFGAYLTRQGKTDDVARDWPIIPPPEGWDPRQLPAPRESGAA